MPSRMLTLFGEELVPEQLQGAPKTLPKAPETLQEDADFADKGESAVILAGWTPEKQYYTIGEVAALFGLRTSSIRYWTTEFALQVRTTRKGDRLYTADSIEALRSIYHLVKERGFTIQGAKAMLKEPGQNSGSTLDLRQALLQLRNQLVTIRNELL